MFDCLLVSGVDMTGRLGVFLMDASLEGREGATSVHDIWVDATDPSGGKPKIFGAEALKVLSKSDVDWIEGALS